MPNEPTPQPEEEIPAEVHEAAAELARRLLKQPPEDG